MKNLIFALVAIMYGMCAVNAGEVQDSWCDDKSLSYCIEHFDRQCESKNYNACGIVGELHNEQEQYSESKKYYEMVCDKADSKDSYRLEKIDGSLDKKISTSESIKYACGEVAKYYYNGWGVGQNRSKALQYYKKACGLGNAKSCAMVGVYYDLGEIVKKDLNLTKSYYEKSCEMQFGSGCSLLGVMYQGGIGGVPQNLSKAKELFGKACEFGEQKGCDGYKELNENGVK